MTAPTPAAAGGDPRAQRSRFVALTVGAIGVVFGDIGTSPLYTMKEAFGPHYGLRATDGNVLGVLSLVFWALMLIVTVKYVMFVMRADNRGEGGIMALMALAQRALPIASTAGYTVGLLGIFGAALFFGDAVITPAISVLSAVEGIEVATPAFKPYVLAITVAVIFVIFFIQSHGSARMGRLFGPITVLWFVSIAVLGAAAIVEAPRVLGAVNPWYAFNFALHHGTHAFFVLGAVVLAVTGAEALYADMGHFGRAPIRFGWLALVFPALVLNYFGQGALLLEHPAAAVNPFYRLVPEFALYPMIVLATLATVIAAQAVISGAFSISRQAMQLGYMPRLEVRHTSADEMGQVYVPWINRLLLVVVLALVLGFRSSSALASAYGVAVTGTMLITTLLLYLVAKRRWHVTGWWLDLAFAGLIAIDVTLFSANVIKFTDGAWFPLALGIVIFTVMRTWRRGRELLREETRRNRIRVATFLDSLELQPPLRVKGTAIFLTGSNDTVPDALLHNLKHNKVLHERNILLTVETVNEPHTDSDERAAVSALPGGFWRVTLRFGFMEEQDVPRALPALAMQGLEIDLEDTTFFASRETVIAISRKGMPIWRDKLFAFMLRNTVPATSFFRIPGNRLIELGTQVEI